MLFNDTNLVVLRVLAAVRFALTVQEIVDRAPDHGWTPGRRNHPTATHPTAGAVAASLKALEWNEGIRDGDGNLKMLARRDGVGRRGATLWRITDHGRQLIEAEDARAAKETTP